MQFIGRYLKPDLEYVNTKTVKVSASEKKPAYFVIGGSVYSVTSDIKCFANVSGVGGIAQGGDIANDSIYYVYAILDVNQVKLIMDTRSPETGPPGVKAWSYVGSFLTAKAGSTFLSFVASCGSYILTEPQAIVSSFSNTSYTSANFKLPQGVKIAHIAVTCTMLTTAPEDVSIDISPDGTTTSREVVFTNAATGLKTSDAEFKFPITQANTIHYRLDVKPTNWIVGIYLSGWEENTSIYP